MIEVAKATVTIIPNMEGAQQQITKDLGGAADSAGKEAGEKSGSSFASGFKKAAAAGAATVAAVGAAATAATAAFVGAAKDTAAYGDEIDKMSQKLGLSAENYQKLDYAMGLSGASITDLNKGIMKITSALADVANGVDEADDAYQLLGVSTRDASGNMRSTEDVLLDTLDALANMEDETQRNALAQDLFGKSAKELAPLLNAGGDGIRAMMQEAEDYGMVLSDDAVKASAGFQDALSKLDGTMKGLKNRFISEMLPGLTDITSGFADLFAGVDGGGAKMKKGLASILNAFKENLPQVLQVITGAVSAIVEALPDLAKQILGALPDIFQQLMGTLETLIKGILNEETIGVLLDTVIGIIVALINNLDSIILPIIQAIPVIIVTVIEKLLENLPALISGIISLVLGIVEAIPEIVKYLLDHIPEIIGMVIDAIIECTPQLIVGIAQLVAGVFSAAGQILASVWEFLKNAAASVFNWLKGVWGEYIAPFFTNLWSNIKSWLTTTWQNISGWFLEVWTNIGKWLGNFWTKIGDWFKSLPGKLSGAFQAIWKWLGDRWSDFVNWGGNLVSGIWQGISNGFNWIKEKIQGWVGGVMDWFKKLFGIHSPSTLFRDEIGVFLAQGLAEGFEDEMDEVAGDMAEAVPSSFTAEIEQSTRAGRGLARNYITGETAGGFSINMTINGAEGQNVEALAEIVMDRIQMATERRAAAYV